MLESNAFLNRDKFRPLLTIFSPFYIRIEHVEVVHDKLNIWTIIREGVDPRNIKISIIGKGRRSTNTIRKLLKFHDIDFANEVAIQKSEEIGYESYIFTLRLFYKDQEIDSYFVAKEEPSIQKANWFKSVIQRVDPNYDILETWIKGKGKNSSDDFEIGVAILFCLCGLNTLYIGRCYEQATDRNRRNTFPNPNAPIDVLAWSSDNNSLYLCQCALTGIKDKIDEIAMFANELDKVVLKDYIVRPKIMTFF
jgi:hypothetical protein